MKILIEVTGVIEPIICFPWLDTLLVLEMSGKT